MGKRKGKRIKQRQKRKQKQRKKERREKKMKKNMHWGYSGDYDYYGGGWATKQSNTWGSKLNCHTGNPLVFTTDDGIEVYAGGTSRNGAWYRMSPLPDLAIGPKQVIGSKKEGTTVPDGFSCAEHISVSKVPMVRIDLPDYDIPQDVGREFWVALVEDIRRAGYKRISTQCVGGHGRTGIQLAILAHLFEVTDQPDSAELIRWVRDRYCHHAVEAASQQKYIAKICELPLGDDLFPPAVKVKTLSSTATGWCKECKKNDKFCTCDPPSKKDDVKIAEDKKGHPLGGDHGAFDFYTCDDCMHHAWVHTQDDYLKHFCPVCAGDNWGHRPNDRFQMQQCSDCKEDVSWYSVVEVDNDDLCRCCYADLLKVDVDVLTVKDDDSIPGAWKVTCQECGELQPMDFFGNGVDDLTCIACVDVKIISQKINKGDENKNENE